MPTTPGAIYDPKEPSANMAKAEVTANTITSNAVDIRGMIYGVRTQLDSILAKLTGMYTPLILEEPTEPPGWMDALAEFQDEQIKGLRACLEIVHQIKTILSIEDVEKPLR